MKIDNFGQCVYSEDDLVKLLYTVPDAVLDNFLVTDPENFNKAIKLLHLEYPKLQEYRLQEVSVETFDQLNQENWFIPEAYVELDVEKHIRKLCNTPEEIERVEIELALYKQFKLIKLLQFLIYLVDTMRKHNIVWGVGRGSSVASYVLYLIGIHKINSIKFNLDIHEFLR